MKKFLSAFLVIIMLFAVMAPAASAYDAAEKTPIIYIRGNGEALYYPDGTRLAATFDDISLGGEDGGISKEVIVETAVNILKPFVLEGMLFDNWDNYGKAIYDELSPLFPDSGLDENGNPKKGTGAAASAIDFCDNRLAHSAWEFNNNHQYAFTYDWRLSPYDCIERLDRFVDNILRATKKSQVSIYARCLGGGLLMAYLDYLDEKGEAKKVKNVLFCDVLSNETTVISKGFSGQIEFDAKLVERYAGQLDFCGREDMGVGFVFSDLLNEIVIKTMDFFNQINVTDKALDGVEELYGKLYKALIPAVCHATGIATQANYWTCVAEEDMDTALNLLFGKEGSEIRTKYAGLIDKIQKYREKVGSNLDGFYDTLEANGIHYGFIAKYGFLNGAFTKDADLPSDSLASLCHAAYGVTTARIGETLSASYIAQREAEGKGKYISADKQVDISTSRSPETTWVFKNAHHNVFSVYQGLINSFLYGTNETVHTLTNGVYYMQYDCETDSYSPMTEENCGDLEFMTRPTEKPTTATRLSSFMRFFTMIINFITKLFKGELDFGNLLG